MLAPDESRGHYNRATLALLVVSLWCTTWGASLALRGTRGTAPFTLDSVYQERQCCGATINVNEPHEQPSPTVNGVSAQSPCLLDTAGLMWAVYTAQPMSLHLPSLPHILPKTEEYPEPITRVHMGCDSSRWCAAHWSPLAGTPSWGDDEKYHHQLMLHSRVHVRRPAWVCQETPPHYIKHWND